MRGFSWSIGALALAAAASAEAQPLPERGVHEHDGLFLRFGLGLAYGHLSATTTANEQLEVGVSGFGYAFEGAIGGTPLPGLVLGGAFVSIAVPDPRMEFNGTGSDTADESLGATVLALLVTYYVDPKLGAYAQALAGYAALSLEYERSSNSYETDDTSGYALGLGAGWDFWVGSQWSIGPELRVIYARMTREDDDVDETYRLWTPTLLFTGTLH